MTTFAELRPFLPLLLLPVLAAQDVAREPKTLGEAWAEAQRRAKTCKAPIVAFVVPPADAKVDPAAVAAAVERAKKTWPMKGGTLDVAPETARELFLLQFQLLRAGSHLGPRVDPAAVQAVQDLALLFFVAVPVVADAATCGAKPGETVVVIEPDGGKRRGFAVDLGDPQALAAAVGPLVTSPAALAPRRAQVHPELRKAIEDLRALQCAPNRGDAEAKAIAVLHRKVVDNLPAASLAMLDERQLEPGRDGEPAVTVLVPSLQLAALETTQTPLGTAVAASWDPCPPCGMAAVPLALRSTLKLLAQ